MKTLIVFTHPDSKSLNGAFLTSTLKGLNNNPAVSSIELLDLYKENFNPVLTFDHTKLRRELYRDPDFQPYREQLKRADLIIFIYPIWWGRPPAMLMGYIDQLFASGFAYRSLPGKIMPEGLLKGKKVLCLSTMKGPTGYPALFLNNAHKKLMKKAVFNFVGIRKIRFFEFGGMEKKQGKQKANLQRIQKYMQTVTS